MDYRLTSGMFGLYIHGTRTNTGTYAYLTGIAVAAHYCCEYDIKEIQ